MQTFISEDYLKSKFQRKYFIPFCFAKHLLGFKILKENYTDEEFYNSEYEIFY